MVELMLTDNGRALLDELRQIPPDFQRLKDELDSGNYTSDDVSMAALQYMNDCFWEQVYEDHRIIDSVVIPGLHSTYVFDVVRLLSQYGLNPNAVYENYNIMQEVRYIENGYLGADTLALLLEHGGDVNLMVDDDTLFRSMDFDVMFDAFNQEIRRRFDALVHCWFVVLGYGAKLDDGRDPIDTFDGFDIGKLKKHREYTFGLSKIPSRAENWSLHIFDRRTFWEVARL